MTLHLETKSQENETLNVGLADRGPTVSITPPINEDYWAYRVRVSETQAVVGFPKFGTVGIGFAVEEDWNTNLPYTCGTEEIWEHIAHNKGDDAIPDADCVEGIRMIQGQVRSDRATSFAVRVLEQDGPRVRVQVFAGQAAGQRALCGDLVMDAEQAEDFIKTTRLPNITRLEPTP